MKMTLDTLIETLELVQEQAEAGVCENISVNDAAMLTIAKVFQRWVNVQTTSEEALRELTVIK